MKQFNEYLEKNEDTLRIFSRYQNWITVNPKTKDRRHPLEKMKAANMEATSAIMPKWMEIEHKGKKGPEIFKSVEYYPIRQKAKGMMLWVDRDTIFIGGMGKSIPLLLLFEITSIFLKSSNDNS